MVYSGIARLLLGVRLQALDPRSFLKWSCSTENQWYAWVARYHHKYLKLIVIVIQAVAHQTHFFAIDECKCLPPPIGAGWCPENLWESAEVYDISIIFFNKTKTYNYSFIKKLLSPNKFFRIFHCTSELAVDSPTNNQWNFLKSKRSMVIYQ